jgi:DNA-binding NarL/FixJ family response regulator
MSISSDDPITVLLVTDSFLIGDGLEAMLREVPDVKVFGIRDLPGAIDETQPDTVLLCVRSHVTTTSSMVAAACQLRVDRPKLGIVLISDRVDEFAVEFLRSAPAGIAFLIDEQLPGIEDVVVALWGSRRGTTTIDAGIVESLIRRGDSAGVGELTHREVDILGHVAQGLSNRGIADELHISVKSIEKGITGIFLKLGPFNDKSSDRRVSAALTFLRSQTDPFAFDPHNPSSHAVLLVPPEVDDDPPKSGP